MVIKFVCPGPPDSFSISEIVDMHSFIESPENTFENIKYMIYPYVTNNRDIYDYDILETSDEPDENGEIAVKSWLKKRRVFNNWNSLNVFYLINWGDRFQVSTYTIITEDILFKYKVSAETLKKIAMYNADRLCMEIIPSINSVYNNRIILEYRYKNIFRNVILNDSFWKHLYNILCKPFYLIFKSEYEFEVVDEKDFESRMIIDAVWGRIFFYSGAKIEVFGF